MRRGKAIVAIVLTGLFLICNTMVIQAAHHHSDNCYVVQEHAHTGSEASGGGCYGTANHHVHSGDTVNGGGCYGAANYHVHSGDATSGGGCYGVANYHAHSGDAVNGGGCYTIPVECGGTITAQSVTVQCNRVKGGYVGKTSWPCGCGDSEYQESWYITCEKWNVGHNHGVYYIRYCSCGINYDENWKLGPYTENKTIYKCEQCSSESATTGTCTQMAGYTVSCGKTEQSAESYSLSCGKTESTVEGYSLNCGKTTETVESYSLSCAYQENPIISTVICTLGGNAYADLSETGIGKKYKRTFCEDRISVAVRCKQTRDCNYYVLEE